MSEMRKLTDEEVDTVCGGKFSFDSYNTVTQTNNNTQWAKAYANWGGTATAFNVLGSQSNVSII
jgi:hypothetical protein